MKRHHVFGIAAVFIVSVLLAMAWYRYNAFLSQGQRPNQSILILNELQEKGLPSINYKDISGKDGQVADFKGRILILSFWASWCEPCIREFPSMLKLAEHFKGKVHILAVSADHTMEDLTSFLKIIKADKNPYMTVVWDQERNWSKQFGTEVLPESFLIGTDGKLIRKISGAEDWYGPEPIAFFEGLLNK